MRRINFFALRDDIIPVLTSLEQAMAIKYSSVDYSSDQMIHQFGSWDKLPNLGKATADQWASCHSYLAVGKDEVLRAREFRLSSGELRYSVDQMLNQHSIVLTHGGQWEDGSIIGGFFATISDSKPAQDLLRAAAKAVEQNFVKVRAFWVGPRAFVAFRNGTRLTTAIQSPPEYDLREEVRERKME